MKTALSNLQVKTTGWYWFEPADHKSRPRFVEVFDQDDVETINSGIPKTTLGLYYGPVNLEELKGEATGVMSPPSQAQLAVVVCFDAVSRVYSCTPLLDSSVRPESTVAVATLDAPSWIANQINLNPGIIKPALIVP